MLEGIGRQVAQFGVQPHAVVEAALHHRVIPAVALAAHAADQAVLGQQRLMQGAGVLGGFNWSSQHLH